MSEEKRNTMIKVAELHAKAAEGGGLILSGKADRGRLVIRPVVNREDEEHPDHEMFLVERGQAGDEESEPHEIRIGGLWSGKTQDGDVYLSGGFWLARCVAFRNSYSEGPEDPDFILYVTSRQRKKAANNEEPTVSDETESNPL